MHGDNFVVAATIVKQHKKESSNAPRRSLNHQLSMPSLAKACGSKVWEWIGITPWPPALSGILPMHTYSPPTGSLSSNYMEITYDTTDKMTTSKVSHYSRISTSAPSTHLHASKRSCFRHSIYTDHPCYNVSRSLCSKSFVQPDAAFTGHSRGEISALASITNIFPNSSLIDVVFYQSNYVAHCLWRAKSFQLCSMLCVP
jgi:hypothetical protein